MYTNLMVCISSSIFLSKLINKILTPFSSPASAYTQHAILIILALQCVVTCQVVSSNDELTLLSFKSQIALASNEILSSNWTQGTSFCTWIGVTCGHRHQRVTGLNLSNMGLTGTIAKDIGNLSFLVDLYIGNNNFQGPIPGEIGNLRRLRVVHMNENKLSGEIPDGFGNLTNLEELNLHSNQLSGPIPWKVFNISTIQRVSFANNSISGSLPPDICVHLPNLEFLSFQRNMIGGDIPKSLPMCTELNVISLAVNNFTGSIPMELGNLTKLQDLLLTRNKLSGYIPASIGNISNLKMLEIRENNIQGKIPPQLGQLFDLEKLALSQNRLEGEVPRSIFNMSSLKILALVNNNLSGNLPSSMIQGLPKLEKLYLAANQFTGNILSSMSNASELSVLELSNNSFTGDIPTTLGDLQHLQFLNLGYNQLTNGPPTHELGFLTALTNCSQLETIAIGSNPLNGVLPKSFPRLDFSTSPKWALYAEKCGITGTIPSWMGNISSLYSVVLYENYLGGSIPETLGNLRDLQILDYGRNKLKGRIPDSICKLKRLYNLLLDENELSGKLPSCLGNLSSLREIRLSYNMLGYDIPLALSNNKEIEILSLANNNLTGSISLDVANLHNLRELYLHGNHLSGEIPSALGQLQSLTHLNLSKNELHGSIPESFSKLISLVYLDISRNNLSGIIPKSLENLEHLSYFNVSFNKLSGEIPNGGCFLNFTFESFRGNGDLCGAYHLKVKPCLHNSKTKPRNMSKILKYSLLTTALIVSLVTVLILCLWCRKRNSPLSVESGSSLPFIAPKRIQYHEIQRATNGFNEGNLIGRGSLCSVYKGIFPDGRTAAIKVFNPEIHGAAFKSFHAECQVLQKIRHRNLVKVISSCSNIDFKALVMEYMPNGDLDRWLYSHNYFLGLAQRLRIMIDVASALEYLHHGYSPQVVHCDLKPSNILLDNDMTAHLADFGISKLLTGPLQTKTLGTIGYMAPEYGAAGLVSTKGDVYSFGILLMETFMRKKPTEDIFHGEFTIRNLVSESFPDEIIQIADRNLLTYDVQHIMQRENVLIAVMGLALECTSNMAEERIEMKDVLIRLKKIQMLLPQTL